jgi:hypothetical protein
MFTDAGACSCKSKSLLEDWENTEHIFVASIDDIQVMDIGVLGTSNQGREWGALSLLNTFKGQPNKVTHLEAAHSPVCCLCSTKLSKEKYLIFANSEGVLPISACSSTQRLQFMPYHEEILEKLNENAPTYRYQGTYNYLLSEITIDGEPEPINVIEFTDHVEAEKIYVDIEAYPLIDGSLFYLKTHSSRPLTEKQ